MSNKKTKDLILQAKITRDNLFSWVENNKEDISYSAVRFIMREHDNLKRALNEYEEK